MKGRGLHKFYLKGCSERFYGVSSVFKNYDKSTVEKLDTEIIPRWGRGKVGCCFPDFL